MASLRNGSERPLPQFRVVDVLPRLPAPQRQTPKSSGFGKPVTQQAPKGKKGPRKPVTFALDPTAPKCVLVQNLEEKEVVRTKNAKGHWFMPKPYTAEQKQKFDRDSVLYYFQCVLKCPTGVKFTTSRVNPKVTEDRVNKVSVKASEEKVSNENGDVKETTEVVTPVTPPRGAVVPDAGDAPVMTVRTLKIEFTNEKDAQAVIDGYNKNVLNQTK